MGKFGAAVLDVLGSGSVSLLAMATRATASLSMLSRRGGRLTTADMTHTALGVVRTDLRCGRGKLVGLAARDPGGEPQAPPQPLPRVPGEPHRCLTPSLSRPSRRDDDEAGSPC